MFLHSTCFLSVRYCTLLLSWWTDDNLLVQIVPNEIILYFQSILGLESGICHNRFVRCISDVNIIYMAHMCYHCRLVSDICNCKFKGQYLNRILLRSSRSRAPYYWGLYKPAWLYIEEILYRDNMVQSCTRNCAQLWHFVLDTSANGYTYLNQCSMMKKLTTFGKKTQY